MEKGDDKSPKAFDSNYGNQQPPPPYPGQQYPPQGYSEGQGYPQQQYAPMPNVQYSQPEVVQLLYPHVQRPPLIKPPPDYLCLSIIATVFCFWPMGVFAILKSVATRDAIHRRQRIKAERNSKRARHFIILSLCLGIVMLIFTVSIIIGYVYIMYFDMGAILIKEEEMRAQAIAFGLP